MDRMMKEVREVEPAEGFSGVLVPGEIEQKNEERNLAEGIRIAATTYDYLKAAASKK
jgi:ureidoglycolate dehydrogenase (NAD+)